MKQEIKDAIILLVSNGYSVSLAPVAAQPKEAQTPADRNSKIQGDALTLFQFVERFKISRTVVFDEIASGRLATYKVGRRRYISERSARDWQRKLEGQ